MGREEEAGTRSREKESFLSLSSISSYSFNRKKSLFSSLLLTSKGNDPEEREGRKETGRERGESVERKEEGEEGSQCTLLVGDFRGPKSAGAQKEVQQEEEKGIHIAGRERKKKRKRRREKMK